MPTRDALSLAQSRSLDLVEVAPTAQPPVCRLLDYGKFRYDQGKREREQRKTQKTITIKELRLYPKMSEHDQETRVKAARRFLDEGHKVKFVVQFKGRENAHTELGREMLTAISELLRDVGTLEQTPRLEGRNMSMMVVQRTDHARTTPRPPRDIAPEAETGNLPAAATAALAAAASANSEGDGATPAAPAPSAVGSNDGPAIVPATPTATATTAAPAASASTTDTSTSAMAATPTVDAPAAAADTIVAPQPAVAVAATPIAAPAADATETTPAPAVAVAAAPIPAPAADATETTPAPAAAPATEATPAPAATPVEANAPAKPARRRPAASRETHSLATLQGCVPLQSRASVTRTYNANNLPSAIYHLPSTIIIRRRNQQRG